jgi:hypothetical protein
LNKPLHIVCLDAPAPPDYGGALEMYYKIKSLADQDVAITLHYFNYKKDRYTKGLETSYKEINEYSRKSFFQTLTFSKPHIVASRINRQLIDRLNSDDHPILLEGIHCTGILPYLENKDRRIVVRLHNDEAVYYNRLARTEHNFFKSAYYKRESRLLKRYQQNLPNDVTYAALSHYDAERFQNRYGLKQVYVVPAFVPWQEVTCSIGKGSYCLYHGNLTIAENKAAALWLIENVFSQLIIPLVIAGKSIPSSLRKAAAPYQNIRFHTNPSEQELTTLIQEAQVHILPDFNKTGVKLKLLHALFAGRFCITNNEELQPNSSLAMAQTPEEYMGVLKSFWDQAFTLDHIAERKKLLHLYNNPANARLLTTHLY